MIDLLKLVIAVLCVFTALGLACAIRHGMRPRVGVVDPGTVDLGRHPNAVKLSGIKPPPVGAPLIVPPRMLRTHRIQAGVALRQDAGGGGASIPSAPSAAARTVSGSDR